MKTEVKRQIVLIFALLVTLISCVNDDLSSDGNINGIWKSDGYGNLLEIRDEKATLYSLTEISCVKERELALNEFKYTFIGKDRIKLTINESITEFWYTKLTELPKVARNGGTPGTTDPLTNFDIFAKTFDENYAFFKERGVSWETLKTESRAKVNEANFFEVLSEIVIKTKDSHVNLIDAENNRFASGSMGFLKEASEMEGSGSFEEYITITNNIIEQKYLRGPIKRAANNKITWGDLGGGIGYLRIDAMTGYSEAEQFSAQVEVLKEALDKVMDDLKVFDKLVLDIRFNQGGSDVFSLEIAGRFGDQKRLAWTKKAKFDNGFTNEQKVYLTPQGKYQFMKPVILITSQSTASAAETFALAMNTLPHVQIIGDRTHGIFSDMLTRQLPNGWIFTLSNEVHLDPQGENLEGKGVAPDEFVPIFSESDLQRGVDSPIERAMEKLKK